MKKKLNTGREIKVGWLVDGKEKRKQKSLEVFREEKQKILEDWSEIR